MAIVFFRAGAYRPFVGEAAITWNHDADGHRLELQGPEGHRVHVLQNRPLSRGDVIEVLLADGTWLRGHYDWSGIEARWAGLRIELGAPAQVSADWPAPPAGVIALHPEAIARWPSR
jgi:hypothetical protein